MHEATRCWILRGLVQGVGFRYWTRREGERLGLRGTVRNLSDGSVEVHAAGPADRVSEFERLLQRGPPGADVTSVEPCPPHEAMPDGFDVRR